MQTIQTPEQTPTLVLAFVEDAHNLGCVVRLFGESETRRAHYSAAIQAGGVVIRACHVVVVDTSCDPPEVVWRIATRGRIAALAAGSATFDLGHQRLTLPAHDARPADEQTSAPLTAGMEVLIWGSLLEQANVVDVFVNGQPAHPARLQEALAQVIARHKPSQDAERRLMS